MEQLAGLSEGARKLALERFQMIRPHLEEKRSLRLVAAEADIQELGAGEAALGEGVDHLLDLRAIAFLVVNSGF